MKQSLITLGICVAVSGSAFAIKHDTSFRPSAVISTMTLAANSLALVPDDMPVHPPKLMPDDMPVHPPKLMPDDMPVHPPKLTDVASRAV